VRGRAARRPPEEWDGPWDYLERTQPYRVFDATVRAAEVIGQLLDAGGHHKWSAVGDCREELAALRPLLGIEHLDRRACNRAPARLSERGALAPAPWASSSTRPRTCSQRSRRRWWPGRPRPPWPRQRPARCGTAHRHKDSRDIVVRALFGTLRLPSPRWWRGLCSPGQTGTFSPLATALPDRATPELFYLGAKFAALASYGPALESYRSKSSTTGAASPGSLRSRRAWPGWASTPRTCRYRRSSPKTSSSADAPGRRVPCQNPARERDLLVYARHSCSSASSTCS
jgi:hypothetical protein